MSDFTSEFWSVYIALITIVSIIACGVLLFTFSSASGSAQGETTGHTWDETLEERNNPLPRWWMWMFFITIVFSLVYLALYPGLGNYAGTYRWTSKGQFDAEQKQAESQYRPIFDKFLKQDIQAVAADPEARAIGQRLFQTYCSQCHGSDARGAKGFPNLADDVWLWGGDPDAIRTTISDGRVGQMPAIGAAVGGAEDIRDVANYVRSLSGLSSDAARAERGKVKFASVCVACHGADGKGKKEFHSANLTDRDWLHGSSEATIVETVTKGRTSQMPAHKNFLDDGKIHLLTAYVFGLSAQAQK
jgi:cytochrome c oxidase cbb3-type subunit 3